MSKNKNSFAFKNQQNDNKGKYSGMQSLGKVSNVAKRIVPTVPPPIVLPSSKKDFSSLDTNVVLVPNDSIGWASISNGNDKKNIPNNIVDNISQKDKTNQDKIEDKPKIETKTPIDIKQSKSYTESDANNNEKNNFEYHKNEDTMNHTSNYQVNNKLFSSYMSDRSVDSENINARIIDNDNRTIIDENINKFKNSTLSNANMDYFQMLMSNMDPQSFFIMLQKYFFQTMSLNQNQQFNHPSFNQNHNQNFYDHSSKNFPQYPDMKHEQTSFDVNNYVNKEKSMNKPFLTNHVDWPNVSQNNADASFAYPVNDNFTNSTINKDYSIPKRIMQREVHPDLDDVTNKYRNLNINQYDYSAKKLDINEMKHFNIKEYGSSNHYNIHSNKTNNLNYKDYTNNQSQSNGLTQLSGNYSNNQPNISNLPPKRDINMPTKTMLQKDYNIINTKKIHDRPLASVVPLVKQHHSESIKITDKNFHDEPNVKNQCTDKKLSNSIKVVGSSKKLNDTKNHTNLQSNKSNDFKAPKKTNDQQSVVVHIQYDANGVKKKTYIQTETDISTNNGNYNKNKYSSKSERINSKKNLDNSHSESKQSNNNEIKSETKRTVNYSKSFKKQINVSVNNSDAVLNTDKINEKNADHFLTNRQQIHNKIYSETKVGVHEFAADEECAKNTQKINGKMVETSNVDIDVKNLQKPEPATTLDTLQSRDINNCLSEVDNDWFVIQKNGKKLSKKIINISAKGKNQQEGFKNNDKIKISQQRMNYNQRNFINKKPPLPEHTEQQSKSLSNHISNSKTNDNGHYTHQSNVCLVRPQKVDSKNIFTTKYQTPSTHKYESTQSYHVNERSSNNCGERMSDGYKHFSNVLPIYYQHNDHNLVRIQLPDNFYNGHVVPNNRNSWINNGLSQMNSIYNHMDNGMSYDYQNSRVNSSYIYN